MDPWNPEIPVNVLPHRLLRLLTAREGGEASVLMKLFATSKLAESHLNVLIGNRWGSWTRKRRLRRIPPSMMLFVVVRSPSLSAECSCEEKSLQWWQRWWRQQRRFQWPFLRFPCCSLLLQLLRFPLDSQICVWNLLSVDQNGSVGKELWKCFQLRKPQTNVLSLSH